MIAQPFKHDDAVTVASWIRDDDELLLVSPETAPPLDEDKVRQWTARGGRPLMFAESADSAPIAYGEINDMPGHPEQKWIGHLIVSARHRGRSVGVACVDAMLAMAFDVQGGEEVLLVVLPHNAAAVRCYLRAGFVHRGEEWKRRGGVGRAYRLLRMGIERSVYERLRAARRQSSHF
jgi:RimJ/RimL family protein N-acetyltransferase